MNGWNVGRGVTRPFLPETAALNVSATPPKPANSIGHFKPPQTNAVHKTAPADEIQIVRHGHDAKRAASVVSWISNTGNKCESSRTRSTSGDRAASRRRP